MRVTLLCICLPNIVKSSGFLFSAKLSIVKAISYIKDDLCVVYPRLQLADQTPSHTFWATGFSHAYQSRTILVISEPHFFCAWTIFIHDHGHLCHRQLSYGYWTILQHIYIPKVASHKNTYVLCGPIM